VSAFISGGYGDIIEGYGEATRSKFCCSFVESPVEDGGIYRLRGDVSYES
jgi:hypothetical protein